MFVGLLVTFADVFADCGLFNCFLPGHLNDRLCLYDVYAISIKLHSLRLVLTIL